MISKKLVDAIKTAGVPAYRIALQAGVSPYFLYKVKIGLQSPKPDDPRIIGIGSVLGLSARECFEPSQLTYPSRTNQDNNLQNQVKMKPQACEVQVKKTA